MKFRYLPLLAVALSLAVSLGAQDAASAPAAGQSNGSGQGGSNGRRGGRGGFGGGMMGRRLMGTVTEAAADHYVMKTETGDVYTVNLGSSTRIVKEVANMRGQRGGGAAAQGGGQGMGGGMGRGNPPQEIKAGDIKVGDMITVIGDTDATAKKVDARTVAVVDPQRAQQMKEMEANFGKTWLMGKVTAIDETKITLTGTVDNAAHTAIADENTTFRKGRDPVTLADIQLGDTVRVDGGLKDGVFAATTVNVGGMGGQAPSVPQSAPPQ